MKGSGKVEKEARANNGLRLHAGPPALKLEGRFIPLYDQHGALFGAVMSEESAQVMIAAVDAYGRRDPSAGKETER